MIIHFIAFEYKIIGYRLGAEINNSEGSDLTTVKLLRWRCCQGVHWWYNEGGFTHRRFIYTLEP